MFCRKVESEGLEENHRVVIEGAIPLMNRSAKDEQWSSLNYGGEGVWVPAYRNKVFADNTVGKKHVVLRLSMEGSVSKA